MFIFCTFAIVPRIRALGFILDGNSEYHSFALKFIVTTSQSLHFVRALVLYIKIIIGPLQVLRIIGAETKLSW